MSSTETPWLPAEVELRLLPPKSRRIRNPRPEWQVWLDGRCVGHIDQWSVPSASATFYRATATHPATGAPIALESNADLVERAEKIIAAWHEPERFVHKASWE